MTDAPSPARRGMPRVLWTALFGLAFGFVEAAVVVYLRALYYPGGFAFPLQPFAPGLLPVELAREAATIAMLWTVAMLAGRSRWERFGAFLVAFGVWDIAFYLWLRVTIGWPASLAEWDILFLLPLPWIGPVLAPVLVALLMTAGGAWMMAEAARGRALRAWPGPLALGLTGTAVLLWSFMRDTGATLGGAMPEAYRYELLALGLVCYGAGLVLMLRRGTNDGGSL